MVTDTLGKLTVGTRLRDGRASVWENAADPLFFVGGYEYEGANELERNITVAKADEIVRRCNSHEELVEALEALESRLRAWAETEKTRALNMPDGPECDAHRNRHKNYQDLADKARAAIRKAKGE